MTKVKLESSPYKGTRDFFPINSLINSVSGDLHFMERQQFIFSKIQETLTVYGFSQYENSVIESAESFKIKSGGDLAGLQMYDFIDKGGREICLRPELTLSLARMVADKFGQLRFPLRWYTIGNCFRYERPQKGRTREFYQAEVNIIGPKPGGADLEILILAVEIMRNLGAGAGDFKLMYNHRGVLDLWASENNWTEKVRAGIFKVLDDWFKLDAKERFDSLSKFVSSGEIQNIFQVATKSGPGWDKYADICQKFPEITLIQNVLKKKYPEFNIELSPAIIRGQAYYTGMIFEIFDTDGGNSRSLFGGGRFDDLLDLYGKNAPAVGFAPGLIPLNEFLIGHGLYPDFNEKGAGIEKTGLIPENEKCLENLFENIVPNLIGEGKKFDIDYEFDRSPRKRKESLLKRGCIEIVECYPE